MPDRDVGTLWRLYLGIFPLQVRGGTPIRESNRKVKDTRDVHEGNKLINGLEKLTKAKAAGIPLT